MKKAQFFTADGIFALTLIMISITALTSFNIHENPKSQLEFYSQDMINSLSMMKINETNNEYINKLIEDKIITETDNSVLEQTVIFWSTNRENIAKNIFKNISKNIIPPQMDYGFFLEEEKIYSTSEKTPKQLISGTRHITGIMKNKSIKGYIARSSMTEIKDYTQNKREYFGGYIGNGNITFNIRIPMNADTIKSADFEFDTDQDFELYINKYLAKECEKEDFYYQVPEDKLDLITKGNNTIEIKFQNKGYIAGGFFQISYNVSDIFFKPDTETKQYFKGIKGFINYYSGINTKDIKGMNIKLHINSTYDTYLRIGNKTVYEDNPKGEKTIIIDDNELQTIFNYEDISYTTLPIRLSIKNITTQDQEFADVILASDLSGSMEYCINEPDDYMTNWRWQQHFNYPDKAGQDACGYKWIRTGKCRDEAERRIDVAKKASTDFIDNILENENNNIGLVEYSAEYPYYSSYVEQPCGQDIVEFPEGIVGEIHLTNNINTLKEHINNMDSWYGTCICCGIIRAMENIGSSTNKRFIVVMSDGEANIRCYGGSGNGKTDAIRAAQEACDEDISVYTVGFGESADASTLSQMACNEGKYFDASNASQLSEIYESIAESIANISYNKQTIQTNFSYEPTALYPDSYIEIINQEEKNPEGILFNIETPPFSSNSSIYIPEEMDITQLTLTSYSKDYWTKTANIKNSNYDIDTYDIDTYNLPYSELGDPFHINIPTKYIEKEEDNQITLNIGTSSKNKIPEKSRLIYDLIYYPQIRYTEVLPKSEGCRWHLEFEDGEETEIKIPNDYKGDKDCYFKEKSYDRKDATDVATYEFFKTLDFDDDGLLYLNIQNLNINVNQIDIGNIPYLIGPTKAEVRIWH